jgi:hypothetical protein
MQFKRLEDDSVESVDGRIILYSVTRFINEIANGDGCFICGAKPGTKKFNQEHVIPDWVLRDRGLHSGNIALPNNGAVMYGRYSVPCCVDCNTQMAQIFETPISAAFAGGLEGVMGLIRKDRGHLLWHWLALIFLKAHLKHRELRWHLNRNLSDARIADRYDWTELYHIHCIVRSFHTGAFLQDMVYGSILVLPASDAESGEQFDFANMLDGASIMLRFGGVMVLAVLNDSRIVLNSMIDILDEITGLLTMLQGRELMAKICHWNLSFEPRPEYVSNIDLSTGDYAIESVLPEGVTLFEQPRIELYGKILHFFVREILERTGTDPEIIQYVREGRYSFLFKEDGGFLTH